MIAANIPDGLLWTMVGLVGSALFASAAWLFNKVANHESRISVLEVLAGLRKREPSED